MFLKEILAIYLPRQQIIGMTIFVILIDKASDAKSLVYISTEYNRLTLQSEACVSDYNNKYRNT